MYHGLILDSPPESNLNASNYQVQFRFTVVHKHNSLDRRYFEGWRSIDEPKTSGFSFYNNAYFFERAKHRWWIQPEILWLRSTLNKIYVLNISAFTRSIDTITVGNVLKIHFYTIYMFFLGIRSWLCLLIAAAGKTAFNAGYTLRNLSPQCWSILPSLSQFFLLSFLEAHVVGTLEASDLSITNLSTIVSL